MLQAISHQTGTTYPEPQTGDLWIVEEPFWRSDKIKTAKESQVAVLLVGASVALDKEVEFLGVDAILGEDLDPDEILHWVQQKQKERSKLRKGLKRGVIVAFAGLLPTGGGVGKDTLVINTAAWLTAQGKSVAVVDLDPFGTLKDRLKVETMLSVDVWEERFMEVPLKPEMVKTALVHVKNLKFWLLPASTRNEMQPDAVIRHLGQWLPQAFDVVIWNLGSGIAGTSFFAALHQAEHIFLVGTGDRAKFKAYQRTMEDYRSSVDVEPKIILNKVYEKDSPQFFEEEFRQSVFAYAMEDRHVFEITEQGKAAALEQSKRPFGVAVQKIGRDILGETEEVKPKKGGFRFW